MLGAAMNHAISVLFERADFDLLLASPVSPRAILLARLAAMTAGAALSVALFLLPLIHGAMLAMSWSFATGYIVWLLLACAVASAGVWFTLLLVKWLGPRRARVWAQVVAALLGASVYLVFQGQNFLPIDQRERVVSRLAHFLEQPQVAFVARAAQGEVLPLLALLGLTGVCALLTTRLLARMFVGGVQEAGGIATTRRASTRRYRFTPNIKVATFWKDVRLIVRDPLLLAQVLPSALYLLPALFGFAQVGGIGLLAPLALMITTQFSISLTAVSASGEECWDLIRMSPTPERDLRRAKLAAGMALPLVIGAAMCVVLAFLGRPGLAALTLIFSPVCAAGCSSLQVARIKPTPRRDVLKRGGGAAGEGNLVRGFVCAGIMLIGAAGLGFTATGMWLVGAGLLALMTLASVVCFTSVKTEDVAIRDFSSAVRYQQPDA
jgi:ABC-2 type transport system permease protein